MISSEVLARERYLRRWRMSGLRGDRGLERGGRFGRNQAELAQIDLPDQVLDFGLVDLEVDDLDMVHHRRGDLAGGELEPIEPHRQRQAVVVEVARRQSRTDRIHRDRRSGQLEVDYSIAGVVVLESRQISVV